MQMGSDKDHLWASLLARRVMEGEGGLAETLEDLTAELDGLKWSLLERCAIVGFSAFPVNIRWAVGKDRRVNASTHFSLPPTVGARLGPFVPISGEPETESWGK